MAPQTVGGYEIIRALGAGGMGEVLLARDPKLERMVALKVLHRDFAVDPVARKRFHREAKALASLSHPGIVTIHEIGEDEGRDFIVMEFLRGKNLRTQIAGDELTHAESLDLAKQIAEAIAGAHGAGVLHRDIKPENIMVDEELFIKVVDFGLARSFHEIDSGKIPRIDTLIDVMGSTLQVGVDGAEAFAQDTVPAPMALSAATETILGTPGYMAPELFVGDAPTAASDVYSLGVLLFEMYTRGLPFQAESIQALVELRVYDDTEAVRLDDEAGAAPDVANLVADMLKKEPDDRPSISEVVERIEKAIQAATQKIVKTPRPPRALSQEIDVLPARRRRIFRAAALLSLSAALVAGVFLVRGANEAPQAIPEPAAALETKSIRVAIPPFDAPLKSYTHANTGVTLGAASLLSSSLNYADPIDALGPKQLQTKAGVSLRSRDDWDRAAVTSGAIFIVQGALDDSDGQLNGSVTITRVLDRRVEKFSAPSRPTEELDAMLQDLAQLAASAIAPGSTLEPSTEEVKRSALSISMYNVALEHLSNNQWGEATLLLQRIVTEEPAFFEAWYNLAMAAAWAASPVDKSILAAEKALELAVTERDKEFMRVLIHYYQRHHAAASALAAVLAKEHPRDPDIAYVYAETVYHDGRYGEGLKLFDAAEELAPRSHLATTHPLQHAEVNGHLAKWRRFRALRGAKVHSGSIDNILTPSLNYALRNYKAVLEVEGLMWKVSALSALQKDKEADAMLPKDEELKEELLLYALARAVGRGNSKGTKTYFDRAWKSISGNVKTAGNHLKILPVAELLIAGELKEELRTFLGYWELPDVQREGTDELAIRSFAAVLLEDPTMIPSEGFLTWRAERQAEALRAELAGDHVKAVVIWQALLDDPSQWGDYLERLALGRNLKALGKQSELKKLCIDIVYPRLWRPAYPVMRAQCRRWKAIPRRAPTPG